MSEAGIEIGSIEPGSKRGATTDTDPQASGPGVCDNERGVCPIVSSPADPIAAVEQFAAVELSGLEVLRDRLGSGETCRTDAKPDGTEEVPLTPAADTSPMFAPPLKIAPPATACSRNACSLELYHCSPEREGEES